MSSPKDKRLLEEARDVMRLKHYSNHTERSYCNWIRRFVKLQMPSRQDLAGGFGAVYLPHAFQENIQTLRNNSIGNMYSHRGVCPKIREAA